MGRSGDYIQGLHTVQILKKGMLETLQKIEEEEPEANVIFMQDNAPVHTAQVCSLSLKPLLII